MMMSIYSITIIIGLSFGTRSFVIIFSIKQIVVLKEDLINWLEDPKLWCLLIEGENR